MTLLEYLTEEVFGGASFERINLKNYNVYVYDNEASVIYDCRTVTMPVKLAVLLNVYRPLILKTIATLRSDYFLVTDKVALSFSPNLAWDVNTLNYASSQFFITDICTHYLKDKDMRVYVLKLQERDVYEAANFIVYFERLFKQIVHIDGK